MKYFLDSAKIEEIKEAYHSFGIDGVTTNPRHIMVSGKPFLTVIQEMGDWVKEEGLEGYDKFPISVEINPHLADADAMAAEGRLPQSAVILSSKFPVRKREWKQPDGWKQKECAQI